MNLKMLALVLLLVGGLVHLAPGRLGPFVSGELVSLGFTIVTIQKLVGLLSVAVAALLFVKKECK